MERPCPVARARGAVAAAMASSIAQRRPTCREGGGASGGGERHGPGSFGPGSISSGGGLPAARLQRGESQGRADGRGRADARGTC